jgi:hypothetical protein
MMMANRPDILAPGTTFTYRDAEFQVTSARISRIRRPFTPVWILDAVTVPGGELWRFVVRIKRSQDGPPEVLFLTASRHGQPVNQSGDISIRPQGSSGEEVINSREQLRVYSIAYATVRLEGLLSLEGIGRALMESWIPGATTIRYGRRWYLSRVLKEEGDLRFGRIGFIRKGILPTVFFDDTSKDFIHGGASSGVVIPFAMSVATGKVAHQVRSGDVAESAFTAALRALLNANPSGYAWSVDSLVETTEYNDWRQRVDRVVGFDFRLERPNPHYHGDEIAERIIESLRLECARLTGVEREDSFQQALDHVTRGYGRVNLRAVDAQGGESVWVKIKGTVGGAISKRRLEGVGPVEAPGSVLKDALAAAPSVAGTADLSDDDDPPAA